MRFLDRTVRAFAVAFLIYTALMAVEVETDHSLVPFLMLMVASILAAALWGKEP